MSYCQACDTFRSPRKDGTHRAELKIVYIQPGVRIELHVCLCCWFAIAFKEQSARRILNCSTSTEARYIFKVRNPDHSNGEEYWAALDRSFRESLFARLTGGGLRD